MTKVKWLLEPEVFGDDAQPIIDTLKRMGVEHQVWPFGHMYQDFKNKFSDDCVVFYGSFQFASLIKRQMAWIPGVYCNLPKFDCLYYYPRLEKYLLNGDYIMMPLGAVGSPSKCRFLDQFTSHDKFFMRPSNGNKTFTGKVMSRFELDKELRKMALLADPETLVVISKPASIKREWRTVVAENKVITASMYKEGDEMTRSSNVPAEVFKYAQDVLDSVKYKPDFMWTLDICETEDDKLHVLEVGSFSCAGLYECNPEIIVNTVNQVALKEYLDYQE